MNTELFERERRRFPLIEKYAYFETAATGLIPDYVYEGVKKYQDDRYLVGGDSDWNGKGTLDMMAQTKENLAAMINCLPEDICFGSNSSQMYTLFSEGIGLKRGDNVILSDKAWISTRFAWQLQEETGVVIHYVQTNKGAIDFEELVRLVDANTKVISLSFVESSTGYRIDAERIGNFCREKGIWFAVDGVQALGVLPVDVKQMHIDFLVGNDYKWMMHYCGTGFACVSEALRGVLKQWGAGWMTDSERFNTDKQQLTLREDAGRYELGYPDAPGIYALGLVAEHYLNLGAEAIEACIMELMDYLYQQVNVISGASIWAEYPRQHRSGIANILLGEELKVTSEKLLQNGVFAHVRDGKDFGVHSMLRVSMHYYNNKADIDRLTAVIESCSE